MQNETERRLEALEVKVDTVMTNHLPHIQVALEKLTQQTSLLLGIGKVVGTAATLALCAAIFKLIIIQ